MATHLRLAGVLILLLCLAGAPALAGPEPTLKGATYTGDGVIGTVDGTTAVWQSNASRMEVGVRTGPEGRYRVCIEGEGRAENTTSTCQRADIGANETQTVSFDVGSWNNSTGLHNFTVTLAAWPDDSPVDRVNTSVYVLARDGDIDDDGLTNERELERGTRLTVRDTDRDSIEDGPEVNNHGTDPTDPDTDGDGLRDNEEVTKGTDPLAVDTDDDGYTDSEEVEMGTDPTSASADSDNDGLSDARESRLGTNPTDPDTDGDFLNDGTEVRIGTNPTNPVSTWLLITVAALVAAWVVYRWRRSGLRKETLLRVVRRDDEAGDGGHPSAGAVPEPGGPRMNVPTAPDTVLSDEEKTLQLLRDNGGRLPQREITERSEWSKSKVSRLLSKMEEQGQVAKIDMGRENLITLRGEIPDGAKSMLEREQEGERSKQRLLDGTERTTGRGNGSGDEER